MYKWSFNSKRGKEETLSQFPFTFQFRRQCKLRFKVATMPEEMAAPCLETVILPASWVAGGKDRQAGSSRAMRQLQMELLDRMSQRMDNAADEKCSRVVGGRGVSSHHNTPPWKCIKFTPLRNKHERTRECLTILMSIKRLIYMHHHQQQRKVPISAPLILSLSLSTYIFKKPFNIIIAQPYEHKQKKEELVFCLRFGVSFLPPRKR